MHKILSRFYNEICYAIFSGSLSYLAISFAGWPIVKFDGE